MRLAIKATTVVLILGLIAKSVIAVIDEDMLKAQGRLLAQLVETPIATPLDLDSAIAQPAEATPIDAPRSKPGLLSGHHKWLIIGAGSLCGILIAVLIAQWATEVVAWKRQKRKLAQDEACRHHVEQYVTDIESPTKPSQLNIFKESEITPLPPATGDGLPPQNFTTTGAAAASHPQPSPTSTTGTGIRLPPSVLLRRAPSLRSNFPSVAIRRSTSSREGSPRSPSGRRHGGIGLGLPATTRIIRRTNSSRNPSSLCGSPRSLESKELTVDSSVKARDVRATGWAPHNHRRQSPATSGAGTPAASGSPTGGYTLSPGRLEYRMNALKSNLDGNFSEEEISSNNKFDEFHGNSTGNINKQGLVRMGTDVGLVDFKLTTSVAEDEVDENTQTEKLDTGEYEQEEGPGPRGVGHSTVVTESQEAASSTTGLFTAKSIKPKYVIDAQNNETDKEIEGEMQLRPTQTTMLPSLNSSRGSSSPRTLALTGANVAVLSAEEFTSQVQLLRLLGAGGAGCVHEGLWKGIPVAVKILHPSRQTSASAVEAFRREVEVMARVGPHPGVISVFATCLTPPTLAIIVELAEKGSLHSILHDEGFRPRYGTLLTLAEDIACAVAHCHSLKLVHRDLKAHNVLLDSSGRAKVADFGLAAAKNRTFLTVEPGALGTASSMAPEQFAAHEVSERCDSYAFGCLLWELITGRQPWEECTNIMQIVMAVGCERRRPPIPPGCPPPLARLIRECWRHNPALRPGFAEIIDRIRQMKRDDGAAEALGAAAAAATAAFDVEQLKKSRSLVEYILPYSTSKQERPASLSRPGLSRLAISSS